MYQDPQLARVIRKLDRPFTNQIFGYRRGKKKSTSSYTPYARTADNASAEVLHKNDAMVKSQSLVSQSRTTASKSVNHPAVLINKGKRIKAVSIRRRDQNLNSVKEPMRKKEMHDYLRSANVIENKAATPQRPFEVRTQSQTVQPHARGREQTQLFPQQVYYGLHSTERGPHTKCSDREKHLEGLRDLGSSRNSPRSAMHVYPQQGKSNLFPSMGRDHVSTTGQTKQKLQNSWYHGVTDAPSEGMNAQSVKLAVKPQLNDFLAKKQQVEKGTILATGINDYQKQDEPFLIEAAPRLINALASQKRKSNPPVISRHNIQNQESRIYENLPQNSSQT